MGITEALDDC